MARKPRLIYVFKFVSGATERYLVENSELTKDEAIAAMGNLMRGGSEWNCVFEVNGILINLDNVETVLINHAPVVG